MFRKILKWLLWPAVGAVLAAISTSIGGRVHLEHGQPVLVYDGEETTLYIEVLGLPVYEEPGPFDPAGNRRRAFWWVTPLALVLGAVGGVGLRALLRSMSPRPRTPAGWLAPPQRRVRGLF